MKNGDELDLLKKVAKTDAPPFLMTRIRAKIRAAEADRLPVRWQLAGALAFAALVFFNVFLAKNEGRPAEPLAVSLKIQPSNQFYDE